ncbi:hypothetical protein C8R44DRAFT_729505 [Mycena epipterygia]|nr:hypothetical protein C8R44DRAFT_729505 [Mycena epipterygia]
MLDDAPPALVAFSIIMLLAPTFLNLLVLHHRDDLDPGNLLCAAFTFTLIPCLAWITARCNFLYRAVEPVALYLTFVTGILLVPQLAGFVCGAAVVLLLKLVPVFWNEVLRSNGMRARVIRTEPTRNEVKIILLPVTTLVIAICEPLADTSFRTLPSARTLAALGPFLRRVHSLLGLRPKPRGFSVPRRHGGFRVRGFARTRLIPSRGTRRQHLDSRQQHFDGIT